MGVTKQGVFVTGRLNDFDLKGESGTKCPNLTSVGLPEPCLRCGIGWCWLELVWACSIRRSTLSPVLAPTVCVCPSHAPLAASDRLT